MNELIQYSKAKFERNKLVIDESISVNEWQELGKALKQVEGSVQFWIGDWARFGEKKGFYTDSKVYDELEEITGLERRTIQTFKTVADNVDSTLRNADLSFNHHKEVAYLPEEKQIQFLTKAAEENLSVRELREEIRKEKFNDAPKLPSKKYRIIYADPPWAYNDKCEDGAIQAKGANHHYPTMSIDELSAMPVKEITEDNAVLFMWVTVPLFFEAFPVIEAWGFEYKTQFVWDKIKHNLGHYNSVRHELLLIATKGSCTPDNNKLYDSVQAIEKTDKHSEKPIEFINIIDDLYPYGKRIELFARTKKSSLWEVWGNEI